MEVDEQWLQLVVDACGLGPDIASFKLGFQHDIGNGGGALSGE